MIISVFRKHQNIYSNVPLTRFIPVQKLKQFLHWSPPLVNIIELGLYLDIEFTLLSIPSTKSI